MISLDTLENQVQKLENISSHEEQLFKILELYMDYFPVKNSYLFRYSPFGHLAEGILSITPSGLVHIREMRDDVRSLPIINTAIHERKAKYCSGLEYLKQTNYTYIISSNVTSMAVTPITVDAVVIGYICTSEFEKMVQVDDKMLSDLTRYGQFIGKLFERLAKPQSSQLLSKRELEVMRRISWGESTKEMATYMGISELTIQQYVQSGIKKLGVKNRVHAVSELFRKGVLN